MGEDDPVRLTSRLLPAPHGFLATGGPEPPWWRPRQVHGARVVRANASSDPVTDADGVVGVTPGLAVAVATADCVPVLLSTEDGGAVAALHAGWRGLAAGILPAGVAALLEAARGRGSAGPRAVDPGDRRALDPGDRRALGPGNLRAAIGPAAAGCCYEVGPEVVAALGLLPGDVRPTSGGRGRIDPRDLARRQLRAAGLPDGSIETVGPCTICSAAWPSYRRDGDAAGRMLSFIRPL